MSRTVAIRRAVQVLAAYAFAYTPHGPADASRPFGRNFMLTVSVVIPVYHAETTLAELYRQLSAAMNNITSVFEIIFVDDGSADGSWAIVFSAGARRSPCARNSDARATTASTMLCYAG